MHLSNILHIITVKELSELLKVKEKTLYQWAELGQIPSLKMNGVLRFDFDDVKAWVKDCKKGGSTSYNPFAKREARKGGNGK